MITEQDLQGAIAECLGQRDPNANTCIKLAAYYTIQHELFGDSKQPVVPQIPQMPVYSRAGPAEEPETYVDFISDSEFSRMVNGMESRQAWAIVDELVETIRVLNPRLYNGLIRKMEEA